jgi:hypothetical protein
MFGLFRFVKARFQCTRSNLHWLIADRVEVIASLRSHSSKAMSILWQNLGGVFQVFLWPSLNLKNAGGHLKYSLPPSVNLYLGGHAYSRLSTRPRLSIFWWFNFHCSSLRVKPRHRKKGLKIRSPLSSQLKSGYVSDSVLSGWIPWSGGR